MGLRQPWHWIVLIVVLLLLFGAKRLPDLARGVGQSLKIFKKEIKDLQDDPATPPSATTGTPETSTTAPTTAAPAKEPDPQPAVPDSKDNA